MVDQWDGFAGSLAASLLELSHLRVTEESVESVRARLATIATHLDGCDMAGMTVVRDGRPVTAACTSDEAAALDCVQYQAGQGPCLTAHRLGQVVRTSTQPVDGRWPEFSTAAAKRGISGVLSLPMVDLAGDVAALNLYTRLAGGFQADHERPAVLFADRAATAVANVQAYRRNRELAEQLQIALESRDLIGQAKGVLMARRGITADQAFELLRLTSQRTNIKLRAVADQVVFTGELLGD